MLLFLCFGAQFQQGGYQSIVAAVAGPYLGSGKLLSDDVILENIRLCTKATIFFRYGPGRITVLDQ
ncbi:MAG: hypothetical protein QGI68_12520 [Pseudomonadales bacterium]|jgi:hypothetical protein|nr:hypothetical protein [Pseudomonadales bacterium]MDP7359396.1 hypothetical protein [Pseudomonadales bacterium]MDP7596376.1 hypothetical protein [Pseudomonadales bacterium]HJN48940.1 hypothetical protein [Pseudomonadales bacterium]|tara:strand:+ start:242 stop:439 length:198 start_codon:yes stop_codon:yes gene_type:complete